LPAPAGAGQDGLHQGILDDVLLIDHVINEAPVHSYMLQGLLGSDFHSKKMYYSRYNVFTHNPMFYLGIGSQEWVDALGWVQMMTS